MVPPCRHLAIRFVVFFVFLVFRALADKAFRREHEQNPFVSFVFLVFHVLCLEHLRVPEHEDVFSRVLRKPLWL
mgnify:CR=1 FL=1